MAQLYKMTLYVCDLEDSLSLDKIETLIKRDALNGISVHCICHFADSKIGQNVEWNDDIDLNRCDCPTSAWEKYFASSTKPKTNADRIRVMNDFELAAFLVKCKVKVCDDRGIERNAYGKLSEMLIWLQQPAE